MEATALAKPEEGRARNTGSGEVALTNPLKMKRAEKDSTDVG